MSNNLSCCFTGYRPQKFPFELNEKNKDYINFENSLFSAVLSLLEEGCLTFYSGMAPGFDIIAAEVVLEARRVEKYRDARLICAIPFPAQANGFSPEWKKRHAKILRKADEVITVSPEYSRECFFVRNRFMVDRSDCVITWFDGANGGTKNTVNYAKKIGRKIVNLCDGYTEPTQSTIFEILP